MVQKKGRTSNKYDSRLNKSQIQFSYNLTIVFGISKTIMK